MTRNAAAHAAGSLMDPANDGISRGHRHNGLEMCFRNDDDMDRRLRVNISERQDMIVFVHNIRGNLSRRNLAENAVFSHIFSFHDKFVKQPTIV